MGVCKFPLALTVLDYLNKHNLLLSTEIIARKEDLLRDTYSLLRDTYPKGGTFIIAELLKYTIPQSDSNMCDILFRYIGGTDAVQKYVNRLRIQGIKIQATEQKMGEAEAYEYLNWSSPYAVTYLMKYFLRKDYLPWYIRFLRNRA